LARFLFDRDISYEAAGRSLQRSREWVRSICLPFCDPRRRIPDVEDMRRIRDWTGGEVIAPDFYPPDLAPAAGGGAVANAARAEPIR
jgi:hypothetical protein